MQKKNLRQVISQLFEDKVIYSLIDKYNAWVEDDSANEEDAMFAELTPISKFTFMKGMVFRNNDLQFLVYVLILVI